MKKILYLFVVICLCLLLYGCKTLGEQTGYNPTFEAMKEGRWGGGW